MGYYKHGSEWSEPIHGKLVMNTITTTSTHPVAANAVKLALMADQSKTFVNDMQSIVTAGETVKLGPLTILQDMREIYTDDELALFPKPGSEAPNGNTNGNYDVYYDGVTESGKPRKQSFYKMFASSTEYGATIAAMKKNLAAAKNKSADAPEHMLLWPVAKLSSEIAKWSQRDTAYSGKIRQAMELHFQFEAIKAFDKVTCRFITTEMPDPDNAGKTIEVLADTVAPIEIVSKVNLTEAKAFTPAQFMALDLDKAMEKGGTWSAIVLSASRGTKAKQETKDSQNISDVNGFLTAINLMAGFVYDDYDAGTMSKHYAKLLKEIEKDEESLILVHKLGDMLDDLTTKTQAAYVKAVQKRKEGGNKQAA